MAPCFCSLSNVVCLPEINCLELRPRPSVLADTGRCLAVSGSFILGVTGTDELLRL